MDTAAIMHHQPPSVSRGMPVDSAVSLNVLCVDDNIDDVQLIVEMLKHPHEFFVAFSCDPKCLDGLRCDAPKPCRRSGPV